MENPYQNAYALMVWGSELGLKQKVRMGEGAGLIVHVKHIEHDLAQNCMGFNKMCTKQTVQTGILPEDKSQPCLQC